MHARRAAHLVAFLLLGLVALVTGCRESTNDLEATPAAAGTPPVTRSIRIMVPCGMVLPLRAVTDEFERQHQGVDIETVLDNAVVLAKRIRDRGEAADVFISPGEQQMRLLEDAGLIQPDSRRSFARLTLVCAVPAGNPAGIEAPDDLLKAETISCPDPSLNSAGLYAREALTALELWERLQPNMILTDHAIESHQMVAKGQSQAGFMYLRCPLQTSEDKIPQKAVEIAFELPRDSYGPAEAVVAVLRDAPEPELAAEFVAFMVSERGLALLEGNGLEPVDAPGVADAKVSVVAFYPDNETHQHIKQLLDRIEQKHRGAVSTEFVDFQTDEGFRRWQEAGLTCGAVLVNGRRNVTISQNGEDRQVSFIMGPGTFWEEEDLLAVVEAAVREEESAMDTETFRLTIEGMTCEKCVATVTGALEGVRGVVRAEVSLESSTARVTAEKGAVTAQELVAAVERTDYSASALEP